MYFSQTQNKFKNLIYECISVSQTQRTAIRISRDQVEKD